MATQTPRNSRPPQAVVEELRRQRDFLLQDRMVRAGASLFVYALSIGFLPWQLSVACALVNFLGEVVILRLLDGLDPATQRARYWLCLLLFVIVDAAFIIPASLIWQIDSTYARAFSVGMFAASILHLTTIRPIHMPIGLVGLVAIGIMLTLSASYQWVSNDDPYVFATTMIGMILALTYSFSTMQKTNKLHHVLVAGWAEAQAANAAKDMFLAQMSHELRTPMNAILGLGNAELHRAKDPLSRERLSVLISAAGGLNTLLDDLLDLSSVAVGRLPLRPLPVDVRQEVGATLALFRPSIEAAGLKLHLKISTDVPSRVRLDPQRLRQVLSNLLSNALRHTSEGGISVLVGLRSLDSGPVLSIVVSDTGPGIAPQQRETIFEPFQRGEGARESGGGRGLGLTISRALAQQMGGDLRLAPPGEAEPEVPFGRDWLHGASFVLTLGLVPAEGSQDPLALPDLLPANKSLKGRLILTVDDIASNRLVVGTYLAGWGAQVVECANGASAVELLQKQPVDLVLLDMQMPGMSGTETFRRIRALPGAAGRVPVVALTADHSEAQRDACRAQGMAGYLAKPILPDTLLTELQRLLS